MLIVLQTAIVFDFIYVVNSRHTLKYGGTTAVAAFSVIMYVDSFVGMMSFGLCGSMQLAISYCYGAGLTGKVKAIFKRVVLGTMLLSGLSLSTNVDFRSISSGVNTFSRSMVCPMMRNTIPMKGPMKCLVL